MTQVGSWRILALLGTVAGIVGWTEGIASAQPAPRYEITALEPGAMRSSTPRALNDLAQATATGVFGDENPIIAAVGWKNGRLLRLDDAAWTGSQARGINNHGVVVGAFTLDSARPVAWVGGQPVELSTSLKQGVAYAVNDAGIIVGNMLTGPGDETHAVVWEDDEPDDLGTLGGEFSSAIDVNELGQIVGVSEVIIDRQVVIHSFFLDDEGMMDMGTLFDPRNFTWVNAINEHGEAVGQTTHDRLQRGYRWTKDGGMVELDPLAPGQPCAALDINDSGLISGRSTGGQFGLTAVVWDEDGPHELQQLLPENNGWRLTAAVSINNYGQMLGVGLLDLEQELFLLTPTKIELGSVEPGVAGTTNTISVAGAPAGAEVSLMIARKSGATRVPGCDGGAPILLSRPRTIGTAVADAGGEATLSFAVPSAAAARTFRVQVVEHTDCGVSNVVTHEFPVE